MSIRAGQILHYLNRAVVDRIQTAGPGNLNIPEEKIKELGNFESVATVRDIPDLSFNLEMLNVGTEVESLLVGGDGSDADGTEFDFLNNVPLDIVSPWKSNVGEFQVVKSVAIPHLTLESASYRFGLQENATQTFTLRGDSIYYIPGVGIVQLESGDGVTTNFPFEVQYEGATVQTQAVNALIYTEKGQSTYALNVTVNGQRYYRVTSAPGAGEFTETAAGITFGVAPANGADIRIVYGFDESQMGDSDWTAYQDVHEGTTVKPAAIRGKDINIYVGDDGSPIRWTDVQSVNVDWRVTIEDDFEFGNSRAVSREATDVPEVDGTIELKPFDVEALFTKINQMTGVAATEIVGPESAVQLPIEIRLLNPASGGSSAHSVGDVVKTLFIPDAKFTIPGYEGRVEQKYVTTVNFSSEGGVLKVYKGAKP